MMGDEARAFLVSIMMVIFAFDFWMAWNSFNALSIPGSENSYFMVRDWLIEVDILGELWASFEQRNWETIKQWFMMVEEWGTLIIRHNILRMFNSIMSSRYRPVQYILETICPRCSRRLIIGLSRESIQSQDDNSRNTANVARGNQEHGDSNYITRIRLIFSSFNDYNRYEQGRLLGGLSVEYFQEDCDTGENGLDFNCVVSWNMFHGYSYRARVNSFLRLDAPGNVWFNTFEGEFILVNFTSENYMPFLIKSPVYENLDDGYVQNEDWQSENFPIQNHYLPCNYKGQSWHSEEHTESFELCIPVNYGQGEWCQLFVHFPCTWSGNSLLSQAIYLYAIYHNSLIKLYQEYSAYFCNLLRRSVLKYFLETICTGEDTIKLPRNVKTDFANETTDSSLVCAELCKKYHGNGCISNNKYLVYDVQYRKNDELRIREDELPFSNPEPLEVFLPFPLFPMEPPFLEDPFLPMGPPFPSWLPIPTWHTLPIWVPITTWSPFPVDWENPELYQEWLVDLNMLPENLSDLDDSMSSFSSSISDDSYSADNEREESSDWSTVSDDCEEANKEEENDAASLMTSSGVLPSISPATVSCYDVTGAQLCDSVVTEGLFNNTPCVVSSAIGMLGSSVSADNTAGAPLFATTSYSDISVPLNSNATHYGIIPSEEETTSSFTTSSLDSIDLLLITGSEMHLPMVSSVITTDSHTNGIISSATNGSTSVSAVGSSADAGFLDTAANVDSANESTEVTDRNATSSSKSTSCSFVSEKQER